MIDSVQTFVAKNIFVKTVVMAMMMVGGNGHENPNANYMNGRGFWLFYILILVCGHLILLSVPIDLFTVPWVWTFTNMGHNAISFWVFHWIKSTPWLTFDQGIFSQFCLTLRN